MARTATASHRVPRLAVTLDEAARALGVSRRSIDRAVIEGRVRVVRLRSAGRPLVPVAELERLVNPPNPTAARPGGEAEAREEIADAGGDHWPE